MRRLLPALVVAVSLSIALQAVSYAAFEQITVAAASIGFTGSKITPAGQPMATYAVCRLETAEIRYTTDGTVPTTTVGTLLEIGDQIVVTGHDVLTQFRAIRTGGSSGQLDCNYGAP